MANWMIETQRLGLRKIEMGDFENLYAFLGNKEVMYAWEHGFTREETKNFIEKNLMRYERDGYSYFLAIEKERNQVIGVIGPLVEEVEEKNHIGVAYILDDKFWGKGYAVEGVKACVNYAFDILGAREVIAEIRPNNTGSRKVAERLGMTVVSEFIKHYQGKDMRHLIYSIKCKVE